MNPVTVNNQSLAIVYDADALPSAQASLFDPEIWRREGGLTGAATGRGSAHFIEGTFGRGVLREYLRGGWMAHLSRDRYLYTGAERSRPFREFDLLRRMNSDGLRVPAPMGALCERHGLTCSGALITRRLEEVQALADRLAPGGAARPVDWSRLGADLRAFHHAGAEHADLNARNILVHNETGDTWLVDFDRSSYEPGLIVDGQANLRRLRRSLRKLWPAHGPDLEAAWEALEAGYGED